MMKLSLGSNFYGSVSLAPAAHWLEREVWVTACGAVGYASQRLEGQRT